MWSVGGDFGEDHNARRELAHQFATRGYIRSKSSLPLSPEDEAYVQEKLNERAEAKRDRDFRTADGIREDLLREFDVSVNDKMKLWSVGGVFEEAGGGESSRPARGVYTRRGGGDLSGDQVAEVQDLLMERYKLKKNRDFDAADAIREDLRDRFEISIDDRSSEWRVDTDEYFPAFTGDLPPETIADVTERLRVRFRLKRERDYDAADEIRDSLGDDYGIIVDDRTKEWKVDGATAVAVTREEETKERDETEDFDSDLDALLDDALSEADDDDDDEEETSDAAVAAQEEAEVEDDDEEDDDDDDDDDSLTEAELTKLTVPVLKEKLREAGLPVSGKKAELVTRLLTQ